jgi:ribosome-associated toxin RatA of RatAB toxin-antitoxin module
VLILFAGCFARAAAGTDDVRTWTETGNGGAAPTYVAEGIVDAAPAQVWALVSKCADYTKNMPNIVASEELSRQGDERSKFSAVCRVTADIPFPFSDLTSVSRATMTVDADGGYTRAWTLIDGDYQANEGSWHLVPIEGGAKTVVTYRIRAVPKLPLPDSLIASSQKTLLPQVIQRLRDRTAKAPAAPR